MKLTREQIRIVREAFNAYDHRNNGTIMVRHVAPALETLGLKLRPKKMISLMTAVIDPLVQSTISLHEFVKIVERRMEETRSSRAEEWIFGEMDIGKKGYLDVSDLRRMAHNCRDNPSDEDLQKMIEEADLTGDGKVSFQEMSGILSMR